MAKVRLKPRWTEDEHRNALQNSNTKKRVSQASNIQSNSAKKESKTRRKYYRPERVHRKRRQHPSRRTCPNSEDVKELMKPKALQYLITWNSERDQWRFDGKMQAWLIENMYNCEMITDENFIILVNYLENLQGPIRNETLRAAEEVFQECERRLEGECDPDVSPSGNTNTAYDRSRQIIQLIT